MRFFVYCFLFLPVLGQCFERGEKVISGSLHLVDENYSLRAETALYEPEGSDKDYRSQKKTDVKVVLKNRKGAEIESTYLVMREKGISFGSRDTVPLSKKNGKSAVPLARTEAFSYFIFRYIPEANYVELLVKGKPVARSVLSEKN